MLKIEREKSIFQHISPKFLDNNLEQKVNFHEYSRKIVCLCHLNIFKYFVSKSVQILCFLKIMQIPYFRNHLKYVHPWYKTKRRIYEFVNFLAEVFSHCLFITLMGWFKNYNKSKLPTSHSTILIVLCGVLRKWAIPKFKDILCYNAKNGFV